ncbi:MAG: DUF1598 domain-containing protein [Pirellulales bacterium]
MLRRLLSHAPCLVLLIVVALTTSPRAQAQTTGNGNVSGANGVLIDAQGVLHLQHFPDPGGALVKKRIAEARAKLNPDVLKSSDLRKVSLNRLDAALRERLAAGQPITEEMGYLAGLTRVHYVFFYPDTHDIVLAGPAEGWVADASGRIVGIDSGRPALQLQDLAVALRAYPAGQQKIKPILCSIDPTTEGLARLQQFWQSIGREISPADTEMIVNGMRTSLGMQNVRIGGIPANTHFAQVLLECDYRMKLIGIGMEAPPVKMASYVDRARPSSKTNALERWFFVPDENCVRVAADSLGLELTGDRVKLVTENQVVAKDGSRGTSGKRNKASELFCTAFTTKYAEIAARLPVFAEMRNVIDLAIASAFINQQDFYAQADWRGGTLLDEKAVPVETYNTPLHVESVCTAVFKGNQLMTPVGGGVTIRPADSLRTSNLLPDEDGNVTAVRESIDLKDLPADRWWWD